jgi:hypothetical protein
MMNGRHRDELQDLPTPIPIRELRAPGCEHVM